MSGDRRRKERRRTPDPDGDRRFGDRRLGDRRMDARVAVELWIQQEHGPEECLRRTANLSAGGMQLDHGLPHPVGTRLRLTFSLPGETPSFNLQAEVLSAGWHDGKPITNVRFIELTGEDHIRITRFVEKIER